MLDNQNEYRKQHYLPVAYLKFFSDDPDKGRNANIFRYDGKKSSLVPIETQCYGKFFYSALKRSIVEEYFGIREKGYSRIVTKIIKNKDLTEGEYYFFILTIFDIHMRNIAYNCKGFHGRFKAYLQFRELFVERVIVELFLHLQTNPAEVTLNALKKKWKLCFIQACSGDCFKTSDHPSLWFELGGYKPVLVILPITPTIIGVGYDIREIAVVSNSATLNDIGVLNLYQCRQSYNTLYSSVELTEQQQTVAKLFFRYRSNRGWIVPGRCRPELFMCPLPDDPRRLSFLKFNQDIEFLFPQK